MNKYVRDAVTFPREAGAAWRHAGAPGVWRELRVRTMDRVWRRGVALVVESVLADVLNRPLPEGVRITPFAGDDWTAFLALVSERRVSHFRTRIARGRECLVAWRGDRPVGLTWISSRIDRDIETYPLPLPLDATYHWDLFVDPAERSNGIGTALTFARLLHARGKGARVGWRLVDVDNLASQRTAQRAVSKSTRVIGEVRYVHALGRSWCSFTPNAGTTPSTAKARTALEGER